LEGILGIISTLIILPGIIFSFIYFSKKQKTEVEKLKYQKEILELEIKKQDNSIKLLEEESKKLDKEIYEKK
jgi:predicted negative regulator of RcsB-dependent stress response